MVVRVEWHSNKTVERGRGKSKSLRCLIKRPGLEAGGQPEGP